MSHKCIYSWIFTHTHRDICLLAISVYILVYCVCAYDNEFYLYVKCCSLIFTQRKNGSSQWNFSDLKLDRKNALFKNIISAVEKMHILTHFPFQKDVNIVASPFFPLCVSGEFQVT